LILEKGLHISVLLDRKFCIVSEPLGDGERCYVQAELLTVADSLELRLYLVIEGLGVNDKQVKNWNRVTTADFIKLFSHLFHHRFYSTQTP